MDKMHGALLSAQQAGDWPALKLASEELLRGNPSDTVGLNGLGISLFNLGQRAEGIDTLLRAHNIDPQSATTLENLGTLFWQSEETREAIKYWEAALALTANLRFSFTRLGRAYFRVQDYASATECYRKAVMSPDHTSDACINYAGLLYTRAMYPECIAFDMRLAEQKQSECRNSVSQAVTQAKTHMLISKSIGQYAKKYSGRGVCFVFGATGRSGTTLLQRLLNSSKQIMVFGEDVYLARQLPEALFNLVHNFVAVGEGALADRRKFISGEDFWTPRLYPDLHKYFEHSLRSFYSTVGFVAQAAVAQQGVKKWGVKLPDPSGMRTLMSLLPEARFIFVYRDLFDVARSYKARGWTAELVKMKNVGETWRTNLENNLPIQSNSVLKIKYEDLIANQNFWIKRLEEFAGVTSIKPSVFGRKINVFDNVQKNGYIPPEELTRQEVDVLEEAGGWLIRELGYTIPTGI